MKTYFKIYQINSQVDIHDPRTQSIYQRDLYNQLDDVKYPTRTDALNALTKFLNNNTTDDGKYTFGNYTVTKNTTGNSTLVQCGLTR